MQCVCVHSKDFPGMLASFIEKIAGKKESRDASKSSGSLNPSLFSSKLYGDEI